MREAQTHYLKTIPPFFNDIKKGIKPFEIRKNDRDFMEGDTLVLQEYIPGMGTGFTGDEITALVICIRQNVPGLMLDHILMYLRLNSFVSKHCIGG